MYCKLCGHSLKDGEYVCPSCWTRVGQEAQAERVAEARKNTRKNLNTALTSTTQIVLTVFLSIVAVVGMVSFFRELLVALKMKDVIASLVPFLIGLAFSVIPTIFAAIAAGTAWTMIGSKTATRGRVKKLSSYVTVQKGFGLAACIIFGVFMALLLVILYWMAVMIDKNPDIIGRARLEDILAEANVNIHVHDLEKVLEFGMWNIAILFTVAVAAIMTYLIFMVSMYGSAARYYAMIGKALEGGQYKLKVKGPCARLFAFGGMAALAGLTSLSASGFNLSVFSSLASGCYLITLGVQFMNIHTALFRDDANVREQERVLELIRVQCDRQLAELVRERNEKQAPMPQQPSEVSSVVVTGAVGAVAPVEEAVTEAAVSPEEVATEEDIFPEEVATEEDVSPEEVVAEEAVPTEEDTTEEMLSAEQKPAEETVSDKSEDA